MDAPTPASTRKARPAIADYARRISGEMARRPVAGIAACFGAGYLAGRLPLFRILSGVARVALPLVPPFLAVAGAARIWDLLDPPVVSGGASSNQEVEALNDLLAAALSAGQSYERLAPHFDGEDRRLLEHLRAVHEDVARQLKRAVKAAGGSPLSGSSPWESLDDHIASPGGRLADAAVFPLMMSMEESHARAFEETKDSELGETNKTMIRRHLLPRARENLNSLLRHRSRAQEAELAR